MVKISNERRPIRTTTHFENFHEACDIELRVKSEIMNISNQSGNFLFQSMERFFETIVGFVGHVIFIIKIVIGSTILCIYVELSLLPFWIPRRLWGVTSRLCTVGELFFSDQTLDILFRFGDGEGKIRGLLVQS